MLGHISLQIFLAAVQFDICMVFAGPWKSFFVKAVFFAYLRLPRCMTSISKHNPIWYYSQVVNNAKSEYLTEFFLSDLILHVYVICGPQKFVIIQFTEYVKHEREKLS